MARFSKQIHPENFWMPSHQSHSRLLPLCGPTFNYVHGSHHHPCAIFNQNIFSLPPPPLLRHWEAHSPTLTSWIMMCISRCWTECKRMGTICGGFRSGRLGLPGAFQWERLDDCHGDAYKCCFIYFIYNPVTTKDNLTGTPPLIRTLKI